jgi:hypothetical protein
VLELSACKQKTYAKQLAGHILPSKKDMAKDREASNQILL